jgi:hypothetical protein
MNYKKQNKRKEKREKKRYKYTDTHTYACPRMYPREIRYCWLVFDSISLVLVEF